MDSLCRCHVPRVMKSECMDSLGQVKVLYQLTIYSFHFDSSEKTIKEYDFAEILKKSICLEQSTQAWCENCEKYQPTVSSSSLSDISEAHINTQYICSVIPPYSALWECFLWPCRCRRETFDVCLMFWSSTVRWTVLKRLNSGRFRRR